MNFPQKVFSPGKGIQKEFKGPVDQGQSPFTQVLEVFGTVGVEIRVQFLGKLVVSFFQFFLIKSVVAGKAKSLEIICSWRKMLQGFAAETKKV